VLDLTEDQKAEITKIRKATADQIKALIEAQKVAIDEVLTDEQKAKLAEMKKKMDARREEMKKKFEERRKGGKDGGKHGRHGPRPPKPE